MFKFLKSKQKMQKGIANNYQSLNRLLEEMVAHIDIKAVIDMIDNDENRSAWETFSVPLDNILKYQSSRAAIIDGVMNFELKVGDYYEASVHYHIANKLNELVKSDKVKFLAGYPQAKNPCISFKISEDVYLTYEQIYLEDIENDSGKKIIRVYANCVYNDFIINFLKNEIPAIVYGDVNKIMYVSDVEVVNEKTETMVNLEQYYQNTQGELVTIDKLLEVNRFVEFDKLENSIIPADSNFRFRSMSNMLCLLSDYDLREDFKGVNYVTLVVDTEDPNLEGGVVDEIILKCLNGIGALMTRAISNKFYYEVEAYDLNKVLEMCTNLKGVEIKVYDNMENKYIN